MRTLVVVIPLLLLATGCGPMTFPMPRRLDADEQKVVDTSWNNMLTPINRTSRETLMDAMIVFGLYQSGVDQMQLTSSKTTSQGRVDMVMDFDRFHPESDQFTLRVVSSWGRVLREERWSGQEILQIVDDLHPSPNIEQIDPESGQAVPQEDPRVERLKQRMERLLAATQPADP